MVGQISSPHPRVSPERTVSDAAPCERSAPGEASGGSSVTSGEAYLPPSPSETSYHPQSFALTPVHRKQSTISCDARSNK